MNGFYNGYEQVVFETPEERQSKISKQKSLFSRVFLALVIYTLTSRVFAIGVYAVMQLVLDEAVYLEFANNQIVAISLSCLAQYVVAFPILRLVLIGTPTAGNKEKSKLTGSEFFLLFAIGEALMFAGNLIGNYVNQMIGAALGRLPENGIATTISETPIPLIFLYMVVLAPIVEELIFRKLLIDRLSIYGDKTAILFSSVAFGLMHGNLYQFFYATLLGALFGYVYTKTRNIKYTVYMHTIVNFMGSIMALPVQKALDSFYTILDVGYKGVPVNIIELFVSAAIIFIYTGIQYGLVIGGGIALFNFIKNKKITISNVKEIHLPDDVIRQYGVKNLGAILFLIITIGTIILSLIFV